MNKIYIDINLGFTKKTNFQWVVLASDAEEREAEIGRLYDSVVHRSNRERAALQQRLTATEQFVQKMVDCSKNQDSIATGYLSDILDVIKG